MRNLNEIRFISTNFYTLQGLRAIPLGLCLVLVCLWANSLQGAARGGDLIFPALTLASSAIVLYVIDRYYLGSVGRVQRRPETRRLEWLVAVVFGMLALVAYIFDISFRLPVSVLGLVFAAGLLADVARMTWVVKGHVLLYYPVGAVLMAVVSLLPLLGVPNWWRAIGLNSQMIGIAMGIGIFSVFAGVWGHIFLVRHLQVPDRQHGNAI